MHDKDSGGRPAPMNPGAGGDETGLQESLDRLRPHWERLGREEPPELLDLAMRNAARRALERRARGARQWPWLGGLATAAVAVLALSLLLLQPEAERAMPPEIDGYRLPPEAESRPAEAAEAPREKRPSSPVPAAPRAAAAPERAGEPLLETRAEIQADARADLSSEPLSDEADTPPDPEAWIERMRELRAGGTPEQLAVERDRFRNVYPEYPLPPDLAE